MPEDSSDDSLESLFAGSPSNSWVDAAGNPISQPPLDFSVTSEPSSSPSETVELYRTVSYVPLAVVLLGLAQLSLVFGGPSFLVPAAVLSASAIAAALVGVVRRSQVLPETDSEADDEES